MPSIKGGKAGFNGSRKTALFDGNGWHDPVFSKISLPALTGKIRASYRKDTWHPMLGNEKRRQNGRFFEEIQAKP